MMDDFLTILLISVYGIEIILLFILSILCITGVNNI